MGVNSAKPEQGQSAIEPEVNWWKIALHFDYQSLLLVAVLLAIGWQFIRSLSGDSHWSLFSLAIVLTLIVTLVLAIVWQVGRLLRLSIGSDQIVSRDFFGRPVPIRWDEVTSVREGWIAGYTIHAPGRAIAVYPEFYGQSAEIAALLIDCLKDYVQLPDGLYYKASGEK